jgi:SAM-dependent methyltransferase
MLMPVSRDNLQDRATGSNALGPTSAASLSDSEATKFFWTKRLRTHGHTGWADWVVYSYDQLERLALVETVLREHRIQAGKALDFGCGTGDFSRLLLKMGFHVCGYDPFVKPTIRSKRFHYAPSYVDIPFEDSTVDLVLSVTVLAHIHHNDAVRDALAIISDQLRVGGALCLVEYALDSSLDRERYSLKNEYQSFRTLEEWTELLASASFGVLDVIPVAQPIINPSQGYLAYSRDPLTRLCRRIPDNLLARLVCAPMLRHRAAKYVERVGSGVTRRIGSSPLKLIRAYKTEGKAGS